VSGAPFEGWGGWRQRREIYSEHSMGGRFIIYSISTSYLLTPMPACVSSSKGGKAPQAITKFLSIGPSPRADEKNVWYNSEQCSM